MPLISLSREALGVAQRVLGFALPVPQSKMMKLVNHASEEIHRVYQRLVVADVREELNAIKFPVAAAPLPPPSDDSPAHPPTERRGERKSSQTHHSEDGTKAA